MNITFLIGNGFDIGLGLKTRYEDFYKEYCKERYTKEDNDNIKEFKRVLRERNSVQENRIIDWSDFEKAFGEHAADFDRQSKEKYLERFEDFICSFNEYLEREERSIDYNNEKIIAEIMKRGIETYYNTREADKLSIQNIYSKQSSEKTYNFVTFNYTRTIDACAKILDNLLKDQKCGRVGEVAHIHGYIDENMIMGLNDASQIKNSELAKEKDVIMEVIKPQQNTDLRTMYDSKAEKIISNSEIICIYGMSLGETDKKWWEKISVWLSQNDNRRLIILVNKKEYNKRFAYNQSRIINLITTRFIDFSNLSENTKQSIQKRIYVGINHNIFEFNLRKKDDLLAEYRKAATSYNNDDIFIEYKEFLEEYKNLKRFSRA